MNREHLTEHDIDVLLDEDPSVDDSALRAHLGSCEECRKSYQSARSSLRMLEHLPYRSPSPEFASRVLSQVRMFEPLHVTVLDALREYVPTGTRVRIALAGAAGTLGLLLTSLLVWAATRLDAIVFIAGLGLARARLTLISGAEQLAVSIAGQQTVDMLGLQGSRGIWFALGLVVSSVAISAFGLSLAAAAARRGRN